MMPRGNKSAVVRCVVFCVVISTRRRSRSGFDDVAGWEISEPWGMQGKFAGAVGAHAAALLQELKDRRNALSCRAICHMAIDHAPSVAYG
jgi:hypothetical protein